VRRIRAEIKRKQHGFIVFILIRRSITHHSSISMTWKWERCQDMKDTLRIKEKCDQSCYTPSAVEYSRNLIAEQEQYPLTLKPI
jgi:hypothetical protein